MHYGSGGEFVKVNAPSMPCNVVNDLCVEIDFESRNQVDVQGGAATLLYSNFLAAEVAAEVAAD